MQTLRSYCTYLSLIKSVMCDSESAYQKNKILYVMGEIVMGVVFYAIMRDTTHPMQVNGHDRMDFLITCNP